MGIFKNIDHELLKEILAEKIAGFREEELKTPEERAEVREQQKLDQDKAKEENKAKKDGVAIKTAPEGNSQGQKQPTPPKIDTSDFSTQQSSVKSAG